MLWKLFLLVLAAAPALKENSKTLEGEVRLAEAERRVREKSKKGKLLQSPDRKELKEASQQAHYDREHHARVLKFKPYEEAEKRPKPIHKRAIETIKNVPEMVKNGINNTLMKGVSGYQNWQTVREVRKNPYAPTMPMAYGEVQNAGAMWKLGRQARKEGLNPWHLNPDHKKDMKERVEEGFKSWNNLYNRSGTKKKFTSWSIPYGHSSGANLLREMAKDDRIRDYNATEVLAFAGDSEGLELKNLGQRAVGAVSPNIRKQTLKNPKTRQAVVEGSYGKPKVPVTVAAMEYDTLIPLHKAMYPDAARHVRLPGTHFKGAGGHGPSNDMILDLAAQAYSRKDDPYEKAA